MKSYELDIDVKLLEKQIKAVLESDMPEQEKAGVHNLLGNILDKAIEAKDGKFHYACGHTSDGMILLNTSALSLAAYMVWKEQQFDTGKMEECFGCYCDRIQKESSEWEKRMEAKRK